MEEIEFDLDGVVPSEPNGRGLRYFKIDMALNGGLGDVVEADVQVYDYSYEGICAIRHSNGTDYWILINQGTSGVGVYSVTQSGIELAGVYPYPAFYSGYSIIKSSPNPVGIGAPCCNKVMTTAGLYDFNLSTGVLTFESDLGAASPYYFEFSPNGSYLYASIFDQVSSVNQLVQYNVFAPFQTGQTVESTAQIIEPNFNGLYLQLASDGKIYFTEQSFGFTTVLGTINCPNTSIPTVSSGVLSFPNDPNTSIGFFSLPNFPSWIFYNNYEAQIQFGPDTVYLCQGDTLLLNAGEGTSWSWGGDAATNIGQFFTVTSPGIFSATVTSTCGLGSDQVVVLPCANEEPADSNTVEFTFPNVITPNSDGINDLFTIENLPENTEVIILNRWGNVVFYTTNYQNNWDGKDDSGRALVDGVYTYKFITKTGVIGHGFLHLIR
jgi:gliding motility-associated-like protein